MTVRASGMDPPCGPIKLGVTDFKPGIAKNQSNVRRVDYMKTDSFLMISR